jgi:hypothetical protein
MYWQSVTAKKGDELSSSFSLNNLLCKIHKHLSYCLTADPISYLSGMNNNKLSSVSLIDSSWLGVNW